MGLNYDRGTSANYSTIKEAILPLRPRPEFRRVGKTYMRASLENRSEEVF